MNVFMLGVVALILALAGFGAFSRANTAVLAHRVKVGAGVAALAGALVMLVRGAASLALPLAALGTWLLWGQGGSGWPGTSRQPAGRVSKVVTEHLEMELDHDSGSMQGRVIKGFFKGRNLADLRPVELAHLWQDCRFSDPQSAQLVEAFLDRVHPTWREDMARQDEAAPKGPDGRMSREQALDILGLDSTASEDQIRQAHRALMLKLHPDRGGSTYLAAKINEAKDVALGSN